MIFGHMGRLGRGKTLSMTILGMKIKKSIPEVVVVSNYSVQYADIKVENPRELDEVTERLKEEGKLFIALLDEVWAWMDARDTQRNEIMKDVVLNSRKRNGMLMWTTQSDRQVDPILVDNTDFQVIPLHYKKIEPRNPHGTDVILIIIMDHKGKPVGRHLYDAEPWYNVYNTDEEVSTKSDKDMFKDLIETGLEKLENGEIEHKNEMISFLDLHYDVSNNQAEKLTHEIFRQYDEEELGEESKQMTLD